MRILIRLTILLMLSMIPMQVLGTSFTGTFMPASIQLNELSAATFDPENTEGQPLLTTLTIHNTGSTDQVVYLRIRITWNDKQIVDTYFESREAINADERIYLSNVDLFTTNSNQYFHKISGGNTTLQGIMNVDPTLKQALLSGYFPDGTIKADISLRAKNEANYQHASTFTIKVHNTGAVTLFSPGQPIGNNPPQVSTKPVSFMWNTVNTGFNKAWLTIKEFPQTLPPTQGSVEITGSVFYETQNETEAQELINNFMFSDYLAFNDGCYYAWQITLDRFSENNPHSPSRRPNDSSSIKSDWHVFQYVTDGGVVGNMSELKALLMSLDNRFVNTLISAGFDPVGNVILNGRNYSGHEAIRVLQEVMLRDIDIREGY